MKNGIAIVLFSFISVIVSAQPATIATGQCIQIHGDSPVYDLQLKSDGMLVTGQISRNAVPYRTLDCTTEDSTLVCVSKTDSQLRVEIGASHVAHVFENNLMVVSLPCIEPLLGPISK